MSLNALLSNSHTLAYHFLMLLRPASLSHFWANIILRECVRLYAFSISGYSSKSISAHSLWLAVHFSGDTISRYLLRMNSSAFVSLFLSLSGWYAASLRIGLPSALGQVFNHSPEAIPCIGRFRHWLTAVSDTYLLQCFKTELLMVETVKGYHGLGKAGTDNLAHAFGDVKRPTRLSGINAFSSRYRWTTFTKASSECVSRVAVFSLGLTSTLVRSNHSNICVGNKHLTSISYCGFIVISRLL